MAIPTYAGARSGTWDDTNCVYAPTVGSITNVRNALGAAGRVRLLAIGHSEMAGVGSTVGQTDMPTQLRGVLTSAGKANTAGLVYLVNTANEYTTIDKRFTQISAGWGGASGTLPFYSTTTANQTITFTSDAPGTVVSIGTYGNGASFTCTIDGGAVRNCTTNGNSAFQLIEFTGLANTTHTVVVKSTSTASTFIIGVGVRAGTGTSIDVTNAGQGYAQASDWLPNALTGGGLAFANPWNTALGAVGGHAELAVVQLDANEALNGVSAATYKSNMQTILSQLTTMATPFVLIASPSMVPGGNGYNAVTQAQWNALLSAEYDLADQYSAPLVDVTAKFVSWSAANTSGLMNDQVHPNASGYAVIAGQLRSVLSPASAGLTETWTGTDGAAWPSQWTIVSGTATIQSNAGQLKGSAAYVGANAYLSGMAATTDCDAVLTWTPATSGADQYPILSLSAPGTTVLSDNSNASGGAPAQGYTTNFQFTGNGGLIIELSRVTGNVSTVKVSQTVSGSFPINQPYKLRVNRTGGVISAKLWAASGAEPSSWTGTFTDASPLAAGKFWLGWAGSTSPFAGIFDDLAVTTGGTSTPAAQTGSPNAITSGASVGAPAVSLRVTVSPGSIVSATSVGTPSAGSAPPPAAIAVSPTAIPSGAVIGDLTVTVMGVAETVIPDSADNGSTVGTPAVTQQVLHIRFEPPRELRPYHIVGNMFGQYIQGLTLYRLNGQWHTTAYPDPFDIAEADYVFVGGEVYDLTDDQQAVLTAAGYGPLIFTSYEDN